MSFDGTALADCLAGCAALKVNNGGAAKKVRAPPQQPPPRPRARAPLTTRRQPQKHVKLTADLRFLVWEPSKKSAQTAFGACAQRRARPRPLSSP